MRQAEKGASGLERSDVDAGQNHVAPEIEGMLLLNGIGRLNEGRDFRFDTHRALALQSVSRPSGRPTHDSEFPGQWIRHRAPGAQVQAMSRMSLRRPLCQIGLA